MKKLLLGALLLGLSVAVPSLSTAEVDIRIGVSLPPIFQLQAPPVVIPLPDTDSVYVVPDLDVDIFFWNGWWWMPWENRWYRSRYYERGWAYYSGVPVFYHRVHTDWRRFYRERHWQGYRWNYERIPHGQLQPNWRRWHQDRYWERQRSWGVQNYRHPQQPSRSRVEPPKPRIQQPRLQLPRPQSPGTQPGKPKKRPGKEEQGRRR